MNQDRYHLGATWQKALVAYGTNYLQDTILNSAYKFFTSTESQRVKAFYGQGSYITKKEMARGRYGRKRTTSIRRRTKRRRIGRRRFGRRRGIRRISRMLRSKGIPNTEIKYAEGSNTTYAERITQTYQGETNFLNSIATGSVQGARIGAKIFVRKIYLRIMLSASSLSSYPEQYVRIFIVRDKNPASPTAIPTFYDMFDFPGTVPPASATADISQATANLNFMPAKKTNNRMRNRFSVLLDTYVKVVNESGNGSKVAAIKKVINVFKPAFFGSANDLTDRGPGQIYMYLVSTSGSMTNTNWPTVNYAFRISYTDV